MVVTITDTAPAEKFCDVLKKKLYIYKSNCSTQHVLNVDENCCVLEQKAASHMHWQTGKDDARFQGFKRLGNALAWGPVHQEITD